jgi:hypothetical protein
VVERGPEKAGVGSSILPPGTILLYFAHVAQLVEQGFRKAQVVRSNRTVGSKICKADFVPRLLKSEQMRGFNIVEGHHYGKNNRNPKK